MDKNLQTSGKQHSISDFFYKENDSTELEVCLILFSHCNLHCSFCFQSQKADEIDIKYIEDIPDNLAPQLAEVINNTNISDVTYRIWGGEVFSDFLPDSIFSIYKRLVDRLDEVGKALGVNSHFCFSTNMTFLKKERVKAFLDNRMSLATSYDPIGRFQTEEQLSTWQRNVAEFKPECVSITLTKQNIQKYISEPIHFERLSGQHVYVEYYIYCKNYKVFAPTQDDLFMFFKHCIDNRIASISEVQNIIAGAGRYCSCNRSCYYKNGKLTFDCIARSSDLPLTEFSVDNNSVQGRVEAVLKKTNCIICKHFNHCRMYCIASMLHKDFSIKDCALARIYDYIKELENGN